MIASILLHLDKLALFYMLGLNSFYALLLLLSIPELWSHWHLAEDEHLTQVLGTEALPPLSILVPAFVTSELKTAFQIGFLLFIPFVIIDLVVASVLMSMGMMMLSPMLISLPFKIMLFVLVDGWTLLVGTLASSFLA